MSWIIFLIGHNKSFNEIFGNEQFDNEMYERGMEFFANDIQHWTQISIRWLLNDHIDTMDFTAMTNSLQNHEKFKGLQIVCKKTRFKSKPGEKFPPAQKTFFVATIKTLREKEMMLAVRIACKKVFNTKLEKSVKYCPEGTNVVFIDYTGKQKCLKLTNRVKNLVTQARYLQVRYMKKAEVVPIDCIVNMDKVFKYNNQKITPKQVLLYLQTKKDWERTIFTQIHYSRRDETYVGICDRQFLHEANLVVNNMVTLFTERFRYEIHKWFTDEEIERTKDAVYDKSDKKSGQFGL